MKLTTKERERLDTLLAPYRADETVQSMDGFVQHGRVSTLAHCENVAAVSFWLNRRLHLHAREEDLAAAAILHDYYLYDWHGAGWRHSYQHPEAARKNAEAHFHVSKPVQDAIASHMWPLAITRVPRTRVAVLLTMADKYSALAETLLCRRKARPVCR